MTREEAIRELQYIRYHYPSKNIENLEADNALYMAIKLLEQELILDKIYADIQKLRGCSCGYSDGIIDDVEDIIGKYTAESED